MLWIPDFHISDGFKCDRQAKSNFMRWRGFDVFQSSCRFSCGGVGSWGEWVKLSCLSLECSILSWTIKNTDSSGTEHTL